MIDPDPLFDPKYPYLCHPFGCNPETQYHSVLMGNVIRIDENYSSTGALRLIKATCIKEAWRKEAEKGGVVPETEVSKVPLLNKSLAKCVSISFLLLLWDRITLSLR